MMMLAPWLHFVLGICVGMSATIALVEYSEDGPWLRYAINAIVCTVAFVLQMLAVA